MSKLTLTLGNGFVYFFTACYVVVYFGIVFAGLTFLATLINYLIF